MAAVYPAGPEPTIRIRVRWVLDMGPRTSFRTQQAEHGRRRRRPQTERIIIDERRESCGMSARPWLPPSGRRQPLPGWRRLGADRASQPEMMLLAAIELGILFREFTHPESGMRRIKLDRIDR